MGNKRDSDKNANRWIFKSILYTLIIAIIMNVVSDTLLRNVYVFFAFIILIIIVLIGIVFDTIGMSVAVANESPFNSMASKRIKSATYSLKLIKNASIVSNVCNDIFGDIVSVITGSAVALILLSMGIGETHSFSETAISTLLISVISAFTVGGKAYGKKLALERWKDILIVVGKIMQFLDEKLHIKLIK